jgi:phosphatidylserine decarboxylase
LERDTFSQLGEQAWAHLLRAMPMHFATRVLRVAGDIPLPGPLREPVLGWIAGRIGMNLGEAEQPLEAYGTFHELFVRRLKPGLRPIPLDANAVISPVDGCLSTSGVVRDGSAIQAKGIGYPLAEFLGDEELARQLEGGQYFTLYLRPKDYHRIHCPTRARVIEMHRVGGRLLPVKPYMARNVRGLYAQNERLVLILDSELGRMVLACVAAMGVGSVSTMFEIDGRGPATGWLAKGEELAAFEMGSTVILFFEGGRVAAEPSLCEGQEVRVGQVIARGLTRS